MFAAFFGQNALNELDLENQNNHLSPAEAQPANFESPIESTETLDRIIDEQIQRIVREESEEDLLLSQQDALIGNDEDVFDENGYRRLEEGEEELLLADSPHEP